MGNVYQGRESRSQRVRNNKLALFGKVVPFVTLLTGVMVAL
jgi:hypothetical protein